MYRVRVEGKNPSRLGSGERECVGVFVLRWHGLKKREERVSPSVTGMLSLWALTPAPFLLSYSRRLPSSSPPSPALRCAALLLSCSLLQLSQPQRLPAIHPLLSACELLCGGGGCQGLWCCYSQQETIQKNTHRHEWSSFRW